ncbi:MAG: heme A synthase [Gammaproteobacteria bacterium]|nr:MAG: heme A synthase [Gammaproteobacteria bacterium]
MTRASRTLQRAGWAAVGLALCVIVLGAFTRLADAGLGCPDWPGCYGFVSVPEHPDELMLAGQRYPDSPVEQAKAWAEMIHRYAAATLGLVIIGLTIACARQAAAARARRIYALATGVVILQGLFGMWTVTLKLWPQVVTAHLFGGLLTLTLLVLGARRLNPRLKLMRPDQVDALRPWRVPVVIAAVVLAMQIFLGAWTSTNYAALTCTDLPSCNGDWSEPLDFGEGFHLTQTIGPNYLGGELHHGARAAIHMSHRAGAVLTLLVLGVLFLGLLRTGVRTVKGWAAAGLGLLALQVSLGLANVAFLLPLPVAVAHNGVAALLVIIMVCVADRVWRAKELQL